MKIIPKGNQISPRNAKFYLSDLVVVQASTSHYEKLPLLKQMSPKLSRYLISHLEKLSTQNNLQFPLSSKLNLSQNIGSIFSIYHRASRCLYQRGLRFVCRAIGAQQCPMGQWDLYLYEIYMGLGPAVFLMAQSLFVRFLIWDLYGWATGPGPSSIPNGPRFK